MSDPVINHPDLWRKDMPRANADGHKYDRGLALIIGAPILTGATRMAAEACLYSGAGLTTILAPENANIYRSTCLPDIMVTETMDDIAADKVTAILAGPGGLPKMKLPGLDVPYVLDAGAITQYLPKGLPAQSILTPHDGEFAKVFPKLSGSRPETTKEAAAQCGAIIVRKGPETIIASPDGQIIINDHASPHLAKGGTGDVLAGLITGLAAQGMEAIQACACAVWVHGEAGRRAGPYLIASQLPDIIREVLREFAS